MTTLLGATKIAAHRIGLTYDQYQACKSAGLKWCFKCKAWQPRAGYRPDASRSDGLEARCTPCIERAKAAYRLGFTERKRRRAVARFEANYFIEPNSGCWLWTAGVDRYGYGQMGRWGTGTALAHRVSYILNVGEVPPGFCVLHKCDTPPCVRPSHLFLGTPADNVADCHHKGRAARGVRSGNAKLSDADVVQILAAHGDLEDIARRYGVCKTTIWNVKSRKTWKHIPEVES